MNSKKIIKNINEENDTIIEEETKQKPGTHKTSSSRIIRKLFSGILILLIVLITPLAVATNWVNSMARQEQVFLKAILPIGENDKFQDYISQSAGKAIKESIDDEKISEVSSDFIKDLLPSDNKITGLVENRSDELSLLLVGFVEDFIVNKVDEIVHSEKFEEIWSKSISILYKQVTSTLKSEEGTALSIDENGKLILNLNPVLDEISSDINVAGIPVKDIIQNQDITIDLGTYTELAQVKFAYSLLDQITYWLPWVIIILLATALVVSVNPRKTLITILSLIASVSFLLLTVLLPVLKIVTTTSMSPDILPISISSLLWTQGTQYLYGLLTRLCLTTAFTAIALWLITGTNRAKNIRNISKSLLVYPSKKIAKIMPNFFFEINNKFIFLVSYLLVTGIFAIFLAFTDPYKANLLSLFWVIPLWLLFMVIILILESAQNYKKLEHSNIDTPEQ